MVSLPLSGCQQRPTRPRTAPSRSLTEQWSVQAVFRGAPVATLGRQQAARGGLSRLLSDLRRDDPELYEHGVHVWDMTRRLAAFLRYPEEEQATITLAALVHDVGKLTLPRSLLDKPTSLTPQEYEVIQQHCAAGARLLQQMQVDDRVIELVYQHHERWDGQGYPQGLAGLAIPRGARLIAIADTFAAITTSRPYHPAFPVQFAFQELERNAGTQFDPLLVQQCIANGKDLYLEHSTLDPGPASWRDGASADSSRSAFC